MNITESTFFQNFALQGGAILSKNVIFLYIKDCSFESNLVGDKLGVIPAREYDDEDDSIIFNNKRDYQAAGKLIKKKIYFSQI